MDLTKILGKSEVEAKFEVEQTLKNKLEPKYTKNGYWAAQLLIKELGAIWSNKNLKGYVKVGKFTKHQKNETKATLQVPFYV